jgi:hypothetical protein
MLRAAMGLAAAPRGRRRASTFIGELTPMAPFFCRL